MSRQYFNEPIIWATTTPTAVANSAVETVIFPNITLPANYMQDGRIIRLTAYGSYGVQNAATQNITFTLRWGGVGGTVMAKTHTFTLTTNSGGGASMTELWKADAIIQVRSNGSSGTAMTNGSIVMFTNTAPVAGTVTNYGMEVPWVSGSTGGSTPAVATLDFTADTALSFTVTWATANAANSLQGLNYILESLN